MSRFLNLSYRYRYWIYAVLIVLAYATSVFVPYYFDDIHSIADNYALRSISNWASFWSDPALTSSLPANRSYRPLTFMIYNFLMVLGDGSTVPFHLHKLLLLFGICILIGKIWNRIVPQAPLFGFSLACLWAVHPALSESAVYLTATSSLQAAFFYFLGFWLYLKNPRAIGPVALAYAASCFSKEEGITLPAILFLWEWLQGDLKRRWKPIAALSLLGVILFVFIQTRIPAEQTASRGDVPPFEYLLTQIRGWVHYQLLWLWPGDLNADNLQFGFSKSWSEPGVLICFFVQAAVTMLLWIKRKSVPLLLFCWLWFYISISPASSVIPLSEPVNERRMLIAYLGFTGGIHWMLYQAWKRWPRRLQNGAVALWMVILATCTVSTFARVQTWRDPILLWQDVVQKNPGNVRAINNLASEKVTRRDYEGALADVQKCLEISRYLYCEINQGIALTQLHRYPEAGAAFEYAIRHSENIAAPHFYYAYYWLELSEYQRALHEVDEALRISNGTHLPSQELKKQILARMPK